MKKKFVVNINVNVSKQKQQKNFFDKRIVSVSKQNNNKNLMKKFVVNINVNVSKQKQQKNFFDKRSVSVNKQNNNENLKKKFVVNINVNKNNSFVNNMNKRLLLRKSNNFVNVNEIMLRILMGSL